MSEIMKGGMISIVFNTLFVQVPFVSREQQGGVDAQRRNRGLRFKDLRNPLHRSYHRWLQRSRLDVAKSKRILRNHAVSIVSSYHLFNCRQLVIIFIKCCALCPLKRGKAKKGLVIRPLITTEHNERCQVILLFLLYLVIFLGGFDRFTIYSGRRLPIPAQLPRPSHKVQCAPSTEDQNCCGSSPTDFFNFLSPR